MSAAHVRRSIEVSWILILSAVVEPGLSARVVLADIKKSSHLKYKFSLANLTVEDALNMSRISKLHALCKISVAKLRT
jgi:hypothetical protein